MFSLAPLRTRTVCHNLKWVHRGRSPAHCHRCFGAIRPVCRAWRACSFFSAGVDILRTTLSGNVRARLRYVFILIPQWTLHLRTELHRHMYYMYSGGLGHRRRMRTGFRGGATVKPPSTSSAPLTHSSRSRSRLFSIAVMSMTCVII